MPTSASLSRKRNCWPKLGVCSQTAKLADHFDDRIALQGLLACFVMLHHRHRVIASQHDVFLLEQHAWYQPGRVDFLVAQGFQLRQIAADETSRSIEFFRLRDRI